MKYNVGDRVRIKSLDWFRNNGINMFVTFRVKYCGEVVTIKSGHKSFYRIKEDGEQFCWTDDMIECKMEEESKPELKFKVGDKVRIKSIDWYNANKNADGFVHCGDRVFDNYMSVFCGSVVTIGGVGLYGYAIQEDMQCRTWTDEMIKGLVEEETKPKFKAGDKITNEKATLTILTLSSDRYVVEDNFGECGILYFNSQDGWKIVEEESSIDLTVKGEDVKKRIEIAIPEGYEYVIESGKIIFTKKKKEYPKTFEKCVHVLEGKNRMSLEQMNTFRKLIDARNAYWTIYGEENGLGKPWEPDWNDEKQDKYGLFEELKNTIINPASFVFPTEEMRDAFKGNFKSEIESCKEFL